MADKVVTLVLSDSEARDVHHALGVVVELLQQVEPGPGAVLTKASIEPLLVVARRLAHERRHHGAVPNPNVAAHA